MPISPRLGPEAAAANLADYKPRYKPQEALLEANRCLFCFDAPCIQACPTGIDIPSFIKKIATGSPVGAARTILTANVLGASCARVCPTQVLCEGACVVLDREGDPVKIGRLQRYATDHVTEKKISVLKTPTSKTGKRVAIIGGGPAGLGCAAELAQLGHSPVVFEKKSQAGGLNTYGIAYYKMSPQVSLDEVEMIKSLGVEFRCGVEVGKDITVAQLEQEFDAIFVAVGLSGSPKLGIPGEDLPEVVDALKLIEEIHSKPLHQVAVGERVAVRLVERLRLVEAGCGIVLHQQGDAIGLITFDGAVRDHLPARHRLSHLRQVIYALEKPAGDTGTDIVAPIEHASMLIRKRGMLVMISDFLAPLDRLERALGTVIAGGHEVVVFQVLDPAELTFNFEPAVMFEDIESGEKLFIDPAAARAGCPPSWPAWAPRSPTVR